MDNIILNYVKPELIVVAVVLYLIGASFKKAQILPDKYIPFILGVVGMILAAIWVIASSPIATTQEAFMAVFTSIVQGILVAGLSVYANQLVKQAKKG